MEPRKSQAGGIEQEELAVRQAIKTIVKFRHQFLLLFALGVLFLNAQVSSAQGTTMTWTVDGEKREALVFAPAPTISAIKHPLVFAFHGHGGKMLPFSLMVHIQTIWKEAIVVYPQGLNGRPVPNDTQGLRPGWQLQANQTDGNVGNKDLDFFDAMLVTMKQKFWVDDKRIYSTGFSNGAIFSYLLWAERSNDLGAIAVCAGVLWGSGQLTQPRALLAVAGKADTTAPFDKQQATIELARTADHATGAGQICGPICTFYPSTSQTPVKTLIHPRGHVCPLWVPAETVKFFKAHKQI
jgi:polyhydroxybutyrate depolymerase